MNPNLIPIPMHQKSEKSREKQNFSQITREQIRETEAFQEQPKMLQNLLLGKTNFQSIQNGYNISKNKGFEYWEKISHARWQNKKIVEELLKIYN